MYFKTYLYYWIQLSLWAPFNSEFSLKYVKFVKTTIVISSIY